MTPPTAQLSRRARLAVGLCGVLATFTSGARAQTVVTLAAATDAAVRQGPAVRLAAVDTAAGLARLASARALSNPVLSATRTTSTPRDHVDLALPLDFLFLRTLRVRAAAGEAEASRLRLAYERAAARSRVAETYARAAAAAARAALSRRTLADADTLLRLTDVRLRSGDASVLDVELARINRGQFAVRAAQDSLATTTAVLELQRLIAMPADRVTITLGDSLPALAAGLDAADTPAAAAAAVGAPAGVLARPPVRAPATPAGAGQGAAPAVVPAGTPLLVAAAQLSFGASASALAAERRRVYGVPAVSVGFEAGQPGNRGVLPTAGVSLPLPVLTTNRGPVALAAAERERAAVALDIARRDADAALAAARSARALAAERVRQTRDLVASAERVAGLALIAYREGEAALPFVLDAGRRARDLRDDYVTALADLVTSAAAVRLYSTSVDVP